ncbi:MAG: N-6 DNA methylase [Chitinophagales bacterium]
MRIERQLQGSLNTIFSELIEERGLSGKISPYTTTEEHKADITLKSASGKPIFFLELKDPTAGDGRSVFDSKILMREVGRAQKLDIKYFGNCNFLACAFFDKDKIFEKVSIHEGLFTLSEIAVLRNNFLVTRDIRQRLRSIGNFYLDRAEEILNNQPVKFSQPDELFIFKIRKLIEYYGISISTKVFERYQNDKDFNRDIGRYAKSQLWSKPTSAEELEKITHIAILMLISKLIFYKSYVDNQTWSELSKMKLKHPVKNAADAEDQIWAYFEAFREATGNFELLIGERSDVVFKIPFTSDAVVDLISEVIDTGDHYNFSEIPYDIIGRIFEELIREDERHKLGQYFTPPHVIDFMNAFAIHHANDKIFDPSCGSGTFLVRAYERKKQLSFEQDIDLRHEILLTQIFGNDLSGYPAYLSMLNLAIRNTRRPSYPRISNHDFFSISPNSEVIMHDPNGRKEKIKLPKFDAIIGNPPYTRQEDIGTMIGTQSKTQIQSLIYKEFHFYPSQRTSIYAYFFYHAAAFLKDEGYIAFICQNSWLDTDYGIGMQQFLLRTFEIIAIVDSEVERFFPSASVNTTIVILRKQKNQEKRDKNIVRFIYFSKPLQETIQHFGNAMHLHDYLQKIDESLTNPLFRINCIPQENLQHVTQWGQLLKAPQVYINVLEKCAAHFKPLSELVEDVSFGIKTGCNEFFILKDQSDSATPELLAATLNNVGDIFSLKKMGLRLMLNGLNELWLLEEAVLQPILVSPKAANTYSINSGTLKTFFICLPKDEIAEDVVRKKYPFLFQYIKHGMQKEIHLRSTCSARTPWFHIGHRKIPQLSFNHIINDVGKTIQGEFYSSNNFYNIYTSGNTKSIFLYLNSTLFWLNQQLIMKTNLGDGAGRIETFHLAQSLIADIDLTDEPIELLETKNYREELGDGTSLNAVNPVRLHLDDVILEKLGYKDRNEREQILLDMYSATFQLIDSRIKKSQSLKSVKTLRGKVELKVYLEELKYLLSNGKFIAKNTSKFALELEKLVAEITSEKKLRQQILNSYWKEKFGDYFDRKKIESNEQTKLF